MRHNVDKQVRRGGGGGGGGEMRRLMKTFACMCFHDVL